MRNKNNTITYTNVMTPEKFESTDFLALADKVVFHHLRGVNHNGQQAYAYLDNDDTIPVQFNIKVGKELKEFTVRVDRKVFHRAHWGELVYTPGLYFQLNGTAYKYWRFIEVIKDHYGLRFGHYLSDEEAIAIFNAIEKGVADGTISTKA